MRKFAVLLVALILVTGFAFAQDNGNGNGFDFESEPETKERSIEIFNMEIYVGFPIHWTNGAQNDEFYQEVFGDAAFIENMMKDKSATANTAIGLGFIFNFTKSFGLGLDFDCFYGAKLSGFANPNSDYIGLSGANIFFGPIFYIFNNDLLRLPLGLGFHMYYFTDELWIPMLDSDAGGWLNRHDLQFGPSISLGVQFHFGSEVYLFSKTSVAIDIFRSHKIKWFEGTGGEYKEVTSSFTDTSINWNVKPSVGIGIKY